MPAAVDTVSLCRHGRRDKRTGRLVRRPDRKLERDAFVERQSCAGHDLVPADEHARQVEYVGALAGLDPVRVLAGPEDVHRAEHQVASTSQHPDTTGAKQSRAEHTARLGWHRGDKCARDGPK